MAFNSSLRAATMALSEETRFSMVLALEKGTGYFNLIICLKKWPLPEFLTMKLTGSESRLVEGYYFHRMSYNASV